MPFIKPEEWEEDVFKKYKFDHIIPLDDPTAYTMYQNEPYCKFYNKIELCKSQNIPCVIHGMNFKYPAFSKPIYSLYGLGKGTQILNEWNESEYIGGNMLMPVLKGAQRSTDFVLIDGKIVWSYTVEPIFDKNNLPILWSTAGIWKQNISFITDWIDKNMKGYTGVLNLEIIDKYIIDFHLRLSSQFVILYGDKWLENIVKLYVNHVWDYDYFIKGHSLVVWTTNPSEPNIKNINSDKFNVQITFEKGKKLSEIHNIGKWYRIATINWIE